MTSTTSPPKSVKASRLLALGAAMVIAACSSTPPPRFHSLLGSASVTANSPSASDRSPSTAGSFILEPIRMPASVDQPQWLIRLPDDSLVSLESERWASPLRDEFRQALLVELAGRYGLVDARDDRAFVATAWRVRIDVLRFESIAGREARIEGAWTLTAPTPAALPNGKPALAVAPTHCNWRYGEAVESGMPAIAAAHRRNVMHLADAIGESLQRLQRGESASCSGV